MKLKGIKSGWYATKIRFYEEEIDKNELLKDTYYCVTSFEEFMYQFRIENTLWFCFNLNFALNEIEQEYLDKIENQPKGEK